MKRIVPFNNVLNFSTDVSEITSISLEPNINKERDLISGNFHISGEYKITEGMVDQETFEFNLPFDIALGTNYILDTLEVDVDDFRYELLKPNQMKVDIDLYIDGEEEKVTETPEIVSEERDDVTEENLLDDMLEEEPATELKENEIFNNFQDNDTYVTYRIYRISEGDTLDNILNKYNITKEELAKYNDLENIIPGVKLIIPDTPNEK